MAKPVKFSDEHIKLLIQGIPVYPGDEEIIAAVGESGFWEVEGAPPVNMDQIRAEREAELAASQQQALTNPALAAWQRRGQQTPQEAAADVEGFAAQRGQAERRGEEQVMDYVRGLEQSYGVGAYAPGPATLPDAATVGEATAAAQPYRDELAGLGPDTGYVPGMTASIAPTGRKFNADTSFDWRVRGVDPNKPWSGEMSKAESDRDERIALQKIQAKRDRQIAEARARIEGRAPPIDELSFRPDPITGLTPEVAAAAAVPEMAPPEKDPFMRFLPGEDRGMVDPNQAYPGSVRLGAPGTLIPGQKKKTVITRVDDPSVADKEVTTIEESAAEPVEDKSALERFKSLLFDRFPATEMGDTRYTDTMIRGQPEQQPSAPAAIPSGPVRREYTPRITPEQGPLGPPGTYSAPGFLESQLQKYKDIFNLGILGRADDVGGGGGLGTATSTSPLTMGEEAAQVKQGLLELPGNAIAAALQGEGIPGAPRPETLIPAPSEVRTMQPGTDIPTVPGMEYDVDEFSQITGEADQMAAEGGLVDSALPPQLRAAPAAQQGRQFPADAVAMDAGSIAATAPDEGGSTVGGAAPTPEQSAALERTWGQWAYNPAERKKKFLEQLNTIYRKAAWLDAIAGITGGRSRSAQYIARALSRMEAIEKYDQEERLLNIWRDVYYTPDGAYDAPATKREAHERAIRLGAKPTEATAIYGWTPAAEDLQQWHRIVDDVMQTTTTKGKKTAPPLGDSDVKWIIGKPPASWYGPTKAPSTKKSVSPDGELVWATDAQIQSGGFSPLPDNDPQGAAWERVAAEATRYLSEDPPNEDAAMAAWEMYYSSAKDPVTQEIFGAEAAINQSRLNIERIKRKMGVTGVGAPLPTTEQQRSTNATASDEQKIIRMKALQKEGLTQDQIRQRMLDEGYVF